MTTASPRPVERRKKRAGPAGRQILEATERLLQTVSLGELSVERICAEAGTSRATYYHYFGSKNEAVAALAGELWDGVFAEIQPFVDGTTGESPDLIIRRTFRAAWQMCIDHAAVFRALIENWHGDPELSELWVSIVDRFTSAIAAEIDRERAAGMAPPGPDSHELASVLLWSTANSLHLASARVSAHMPSETALFDTVMSVWVRSIYGRPD
jgi:TetR/AcrR family transcriptional regulator, ethionamide resistance regulator